MKRDPALDPFRDRDDFRLLMLDCTFPTKPFARTSGRLELAHRNTIVSSNPITHVRPSTRGAAAYPFMKQYADSNCGPMAQPSRPQYP